MTNHTVNFCWRLHGYPENQQNNRQKKGSNTETPVANQSETAVMDNPQRTPT